jgi:hypothetical protein
LENHIAKHGQEEYQKSIPEPLGGKKLRRFTITGAFAALGKKLTSSAVTVAESFVSTNDGNKQRHKKIYHTQPRKEDIKESKGEIQDRPNPKIIIPILLFHLDSLLSVMAMQPAGQVLAQRPQPTHLDASTTA